jgi:hypothetical protein
MGICILQKIGLSFAGKKHTMKSIILSISTLFLSIAAFAQSNPPDYIHEVGLYGGVSAFTNPVRTNYKGDRNIVPYTVSGNYYYNFSDRFQAGIDIQMTRWETQGSYQYPGMMNSAGFNHNVNYVLADRAWALTARANYVIPMYDNYRINRSNFYMGVAAGAVFTVNDGRTEYAQYNQLAGAENRYMDSYHYEAGTGYTVGVQLGFNYYISNHVGFNIEGAPRYVNVQTKNHELGTINGNFELFYFPATVGLKFRF